MFPKVYVSDITKEATIETMLSNNFEPCYKFLMTFKQTEVEAQLDFSPPSAIYTTCYFFSSWACKTNKSLLLMFCL